MNTNVICWLVSFSLAANCFFATKLYHDNAVKRESDAPAQRVVTLRERKTLGELEEKNGLDFIGVSRIQYSDSFGRALFDPDIVIDEEEESNDLTPDQKVFIATIYAEALVSANGNYVSPIARQAIACVIMNRIGQREWARFQTAGEVCAFSGFSAHDSYNYQECMKYLDNRDGSNQQIEELISQVLPIYTGELPDITGGAQLFYTPAAMRPHTELHWNFGLLEEVILSGVDPYFEGRFFRYKG